MSENINGSKEKCFDYFYNETHSGRIKLYSMKNSTGGINPYLYYWCTECVNRWLDKGWFPILEEEDGHICKLICDCNAREAVRF